MKRTWFIRVTSIATMALAAGLTVASAGQRAIPPKFIDISASPAKLSFQDNTFLESRRRSPHTEWIIPVSLNPSALTSKQFEVYLYDSSVVVRIDNSGRMKSVGENLRGEAFVVGESITSDHGGSRSVRITKYPDGTIDGTIRVDDSYYRFGPLPSGGHFLSKQDLSQLHDSADDVMLRDLRIEPPVGLAKNSPQQTDKIRVLIGFTSAAQAQAGSVQQLASAVQDAMENAMLSYGFNDIDLELEISAYAAPAYTEQNVSYALSDLYYGDSGMWLMHVARNNSYADVMAMVVHAPADSTCGQAASVGSYDYTAMFVVQLNCLPSHVFAHELGHLIWADHNVEDAIYSLVPYGHGYRVEADPGTSSPGWSTIMSVTQTCATHCPRQNKWSSPLHSHLGVPTGTTTTHDNARVLNEMKSVVANFYPDPPAAIELPAGQFMHFKPHPVDAGVTTMQVLK